MQGVRDRPDLSTARDDGNQVQFSAEIGGRAQFVMTSEQEVHEVVLTDVIAFVGTFHSA